jgi:hypothetical protein
MKKEKNGTHMLSGSFIAPGLPAPGNFETQKKSVNKNKIKTK